LFIVGSIEKNEVLQIEDPCSVGLYRYLLIQLLHQFNVVTITAQGTNSSLKTLFIVEPEAETLYLNESYILKVKQIAILLIFAKNKIILEFFHVTLVLSVYKFSFVSKVKN
jgi:hypothetical protein